MLTLLAWLLSSSCAPPPSTHTVTALDDGRQVALRVDNVLVVELPANRTTGYSWAVSATAGSVLERDGEPLYLEQVPPGRVGAGGTEVWRFRATRPGRQSLRFEYRRPWEKSVAPAKVVTYEVIVQGA